MIYISSNIEKEKNKRINNNHHPALGQNGSPASRTVHDYIFLKILFLINTVNIISTIRTVFLSRLNPGTTYGTSHIITI